MLIANYKWGNQIFDNIVFHQSKTESWEIYSFMLCYVFYSIVNGFILNDYIDCIFECYYLTIFLICIVLTGN